MTLFYDAIAYISGSSIAPRLRGTVKFKSQDGGTWVYADISGLPPFSPAENDKPQVSPFGFHIHDGNQCGDNTGSNPFQSAGGHWNPDGQLHGNHAGDFPVLIASHGLAKLAFFTDRFTPEDIIGRTIIIHQSPDDYRTQPSGDSGLRIGCGVIM